MLTEQGLLDVFHLILDGHKDLLEVVGLRGWRVCPWHLEKKISSTVRTIEP